MRQEYTCFAGSPAAERPIECAPCYDAPDLDANPLTVVGEWALQNCPRVDVTTRPNDSRTLRENMPQSHGVFEDDANLAVLQMFLDNGFTDNKQLAEHIARLSNAPKPVQKARNFVHYLREQSYIKRIVINGTVFLAKSSEEDWQWIREHPSMVDFVERTTTLQ